jgi:hypothetical protein
VECWRSGAGRAAFRIRRISVGRRWAQWPVEARPNRVKGWRLWKRFGGPVGRAAGSIRSRASGRAGRPSSLVCWAIVPRGTSAVLPGEHRHARLIGLGQLVLGSFGERVVHPEREPRRSIHAGSTRRCRESPQAGRCGSARYRCHCGLLAQLGMFHVEHTKFAAAPARSLGKRDGLRGTGDDAGVAAVRYSMSTRWFGICGSRVGRRRGAAAEPTMCLAGCPPRLAVLALGQVCDGRLAANLTLRLCPARVEHRPVSTNRDRRRLRF